MRCMREWPVARPSDAAGRSSPAGGVFSKMTGTRDGSGDADSVVAIERRGATLVLTLNRPQARNAVNQEMAAGIAAGLERLDADDELRVAIITGAGGTFCAGMDLKAFVAGESGQVQGRGFAGIVEYSSRKPLIAAVEGFALAGGLEIALACDLIVASRDVRLGLPEVKRGLVAGAGGLIRLPRRVPYHLAMELALTGGFIGAERAAGVGLVSRLAEPGRALAVGLELAEEVIANAPLAVEVSKRILVEQRDWSEEEQWTRQAELLEPIFASADAREGAVAFAEKRPPQWKGR